jgi:hypothetical protein
VWAGRCVLLGLDTFDRLEKRLLLVGTRDSLREKREA